MVLCSKYNANGTIINQMSLSNLGLSKSCFLDTHVERFQRVVITPEIDDYRVFVNEEPLSDSNCLGSVLFTSPFPPEMSKHSLHHLKRKLQSLHDARDYRTLVTNLCESQSLQ